MVAGGAGVRAIVARVASVLTDKDSEMKDNSEYFEDVPVEVVCMIGFSAFLLMLRYITPTTDLMLTQTYLRDHYPALLTKKDAKKRRRRRRKIATEGNSSNGLSNRNGASDLDDKILQPEDALQETNAVLAQIEETEQIVEALDVGEELKDVESVEEEEHCNEAETSSQDSTEIEHEVSDCKTLPNPLAEDPKTQEHIEECLENSTKQQVIPVKVVNAVSNVGIPPSAHSSSLKQKRHSTLSRRKSTLNGLSPVATVPKQVEPEKNETIPREESPVVDLESGPTFSFEGISRTIQTRKSEPLVSNTQSWSFWIITSCTVPKGFDLCVAASQNGDWKDDMLIEMSPFKPGNDFPTKLANHLAENATSNFHWRFHIVLPIQFSKIQYRFALRSRDVKAPSVSWECNSTREISRPTQCLSSSYRSSFIADNLQFPKGNDTSMASSSVLYGPTPAEASKVAAETTDPCVAEDSKDIHNNSDIPRPTLEREISWKEVVCQSSSVSNDDDAMFVLAWRTLQLVNTQRRKLIESCKETKTLYSKRRDSSSFALRSIAPAPTKLHDIEEDLVKQVEYYFSEENLTKDMFLRNRMNSEGFVFMSVIVHFNRVKSLVSMKMNDCDARSVTTESTTSTSNSEEEEDDDMATFSMSSQIHCLVSAIDRLSNNLEVVVDRYPNGELKKDRVVLAKVRSKLDWKRWILDSSIDSRKSPEVLLKATDYRTQPSLLRRASTNSIRRLAPNTPQPTPLSNAAPVPPHFFQAPFPPPPLPHFQFQSSVTNPRFIR